jgi:outer membrane protein assembly factor BamB
LTRRGALAALATTSLTGCFSVVGDDGEPGGSTSGPGFDAERPDAPHAARMAGYDAEHTGSPDGDAGPDRTPEEAWRTGESLGAPAPPVVVGEAVYVNALDGVHGYAARDGSRRWTFDANATDYEASAVVTANGVVYAGRTDAVYALDAADGSERWRFRPPEADRVSPPAVVDGTVYVGAQGSPEAGGRLHALDAADGSERWTVEVGGGVLSAPTVVDGTAFVVSGTGGLHAVDGAARAIRWTHDLPGPVPAAPAVADGTAYVAAEDGYRAVETADGSERWTRSTAVERTAGAGLSVVDGTVYAGGDEEGRLHALAATDGSERWTATARNTVNAPAVVDGTVYATAVDGSLRALRAADGSEQWRLAVAADGVSRPAVAGGRLHLAAGESAYAFG